MSPADQDAYCVDVDGRWRLYTNALAGWRMLGTLQHGVHVGALAESTPGILCLVNAGAVRSLDQRRARAALEASIAANAPADATDRVDD